MNVIIQHQTLKLSLSNAFFLHLVDLWYFSIVLWYRRFEFVRQRWKKKKKKNDNDDVSQYPKPSWSLWLRAILSTANHSLL